mgnify:FL=1
MINTKKIRKQLINAGHPVTMMFVQNSETKNSKKHLILPIEVNNGQTVISNDFYKHITTIKKY